MTPFPVNYMAEAFASDRQNARQTIYIQTPFPVNYMAGAFASDRQNA
jgi:hypothetical protein